MTSVPPFRKWRNSTPTIARARLFRFLRRLGALCVSVANLAFAQALAPPDKNGMTFPITRAGHLLTVPGSVGSVTTGWQKTSGALVVDTGAIQTMIHFAAAGITRQAFTAAVASARRTRREGQFSGVAYRVDLSLDAASGQPRLLLPNHPVLLIDVEALVWPTPSRPLGVLGQDVLADFPHLCLTRTTLHLALVQATP